MSDLDKTTKYENAISNAYEILNKEYLGNLGNSYPLVNQHDNALTNEDTFLNDLNRVVRFQEITEIILNRKENMRDKLVSVYSSVGATRASVILMIHGEKDRVKISLGIKNHDSSETYKNADIMSSTLKGNFPGTRIKNILKSDLKEKIKNEITQLKSVASVSDIPGLRSEDETNDRQFTQGIEKLIDTMQGETYTLLLIADPISRDNLTKNRLSLENIYSSLAPVSQQQLTVGKNESKAITKTVTDGISQTLTENVSDAVSHTKGCSHTESSSFQVSNGFFLGIGGAGVAVGLSKGIGLSKGRSDSESFSDTKTHTDGYSKSNGSNHQISDGQTASQGTSESITLKYENHTIKKMMDRIDLLLNRLDECSDLGMWNSAAYCLADSEHVAQMLASTYHSLIRGKKSSLENGGITLWPTDKAKLLISGPLAKFEHPTLKVNSIELSPGMLISSAELAIAAGFPNHSVPGIPVIECAEFGRTVASYDNNNLENKTNSIDLGKIFHMHQVDENLDVSLDPDSLCMHTFVTGSTGSGKSNTVYHILNQIQKLSAHFLVIEPAKGEYKRAFADIAKVYGTSPGKIDLLKINPFSFNDQTHILEHLDRLIEVFNACWPMYAAMPAVLKEAVEKAYKDVGWDLTLSVNHYGRMFPTFSDVERNIKTVIDSSEYNNENKGAYKGALLTRLHSMSNGINGLCFVENELSEKELFDKNVIIDLSRVGSSETKSLFMGIILIKLLEYRMSSGLSNTHLKHITVLEEAHNLLKATASPTSLESSNIAAKSVEMLTNSIAEMRTYGEAFMIVDQAPGFLDPAAIRNTNTKIIMRLPDYSDRELVGKAANLNEDQINELSRLPKGVASVYQNEWIEPVLCKITHADVCDQKFEYKDTLSSDFQNEIATKLSICKKLFNGINSKEFNEKELNCLTSYAKAKIFRYIEDNPDEENYLELSPIVSILFPEFIELYQSKYETNLDNTDAKMQLINSVKEIEKDSYVVSGIVQCIITDYVFNIMKKPELFTSMIFGKKYV